MEFGYIVGWVGVLCGLMVAPPQLIKILRTGGTNDVSLATYVFLACALTCYLIHAIYIGSIVFQVAQLCNLSINSIILVLLIKNRRRHKKN